MFNTLFRDYLALNMDKRSSSKETLMCTSDIIETIFGRIQKQAQPKSDEWDKRYGAHHTSHDIQAKRRRNHDYHGLSYAEADQTMEKR
jgi:hypothetical protein